MAAPWAQAIALLRELVVAPAAHLVGAGAYLLPQVLLSKGGDAQGAGIVLVLGRHGAAVGAARGGAGAGVLGLLASGRWKGLTAVLQRLLTDDTLQALSAMALAG